MKEVLNFIKWQLKKWKWSDYLWFSACGMIGFGWSGNQYVFFTGCVIAFVMATGYMISMQWNSYKRDRNKLFDTIKDS